MTETSIFMHEIKNSLSNIYALVEIIENNPEEAKECLPLIKKSIRQIKNIESDYDEYRKSGIQPIKLTNINLSSILLNLAEEYKPTANEKNVSIKVTSKNIKVSTDVTKLRQVLANLISNAVKYNIQNGIVHLECKLLNDKPMIVISDTGIGMEQSEIDALGTMFYRSKKIEAPGTGLGWALIKSIEDIMGWKITVKSRVSTTRIEYTTIITLCL